MKDYPVITAEQAKRITGGRTPLIPVEYDTALKALEACCTLDETKYWSDKADALAAWAKIHQSDEAEIKAKRLKLHAYRRMGILAEQIRPRRTGPGGAKPGPLSALIEAGVPKPQATLARAISKIEKPKFDAAVQSKRPPTPSTIVPRVALTSSEAWTLLAGAGSSLVGFRTFCRKHKAAELARLLAKDEKQKAVSAAREATEWLDEFLDNLEKKHDR